MAHISRGIHTSGNEKLERVSVKIPSTPVASGSKRYVSSASRYAAYVINPIKGDEADEALCAAALEATGGDAIKFIDWVYMTGDPRVMAYLDSRILSGKIATISEDASAEIAKIAAEAGIEISAGVKATKKKATAPSE